MEPGRYITVERDLTEGIVPRKWYKILEEKRDEYKLCNGAGGSFYVRKDSCGEILQRDLEYTFKYKHEEQYNYIKPKHYDLWDNTDALTIMKKALTAEEYVGFLKGNILKYQLRLGSKPGESIERDQEKINTYKQILKECRNS